MGVVVLPSWRSWPVRTSPLAVAGAPALPMSLAFQDRYDRARRGYVDPSEVGVGPPAGDRNIPQLGGLALWGRGYCRGEVGMNSTISIVIAVLVIILLVILILQFV